MAIRYLDFTLPCIKMLKQEKKYCLILHRSHACVHRISLTQFEIASNTTLQSRSSNLRSLLCKLDETSDSREFHYRLDFDWFKK